MTQLTASVAIGTAATVLAIILLALRAKFQDHRPVLELAQRWISMGTSTSGLVLALLSAIAVFSFTHIPEHEPRTASSASASLLDESSTDAKAVQDLRAYANDVGATGQPAADMPPASNSAALPDVDSMIAKLFARLEKQPDDVKGWKLLGWSYLNTGRLEEATKAYETALKLDPGDPELKKALEAAQSAQTAATQTAPSDPSVQASSPTAQDTKAAEGQSAAQTDSMIRGMVDRLAKRLETSPNDEDGWVQLMRSRMTLSEKDAAKAALTKALETFASDAAAKDRLTSAARELGVESN